MSIQTILTQFTGPYFVATVEDGQPRVRPFGLVLEHQGRIYFGVGDQKASYRQLVEQPAEGFFAVGFTDRAEITGLQPCWRKSLG